MSIVVFALFLWTKVLIVVFCLNMYAKIVTLQIQYKKLRFFLLFIC